MLRERAAPAGGGGAKPAITKPSGLATKVECVKVAEALKLAPEVRNRALMLGHPCFLLY